MKTLAAWLEEHQILLWCWF